MYESILNVLKKKNVVLEDGLTVDKIVVIENLYEIKFPEDLQKFLMVALPVSKGFFNWRNKEQANIEFIKKQLMSLPDISMRCQVKFIGVKIGEKNQKMKRFLKVWLKRN